MTNIIRKIIIDKLLKDSIVDIIKDINEEGIKIGKHSIYLRPTYIDMSGNDLRNVAGGSNGDTYIMSISGSTYYAKNCTTGITTTSSNFSTLINDTMLLMTGGGSISLKEGTFLALQKIVLQNKISIYGSKGTEIRLGYNGILLEMNNASDCIIDGCYMYGNKSVFNSGANTAISIIGNSYRNSITNNYIYNFNGRGIFISSSTSIYNTIIGNTVEDVKYEGISVFLSSNNTISKNFVKKTGNHGIIVGGGNHNIIESNTVDHAGENLTNINEFAHGIAVDGNAGLNPCFGNKVINNIVTNAYQAGIEIADSAHSTTVSGNYINDPGHDNRTTVNVYGIYVGGYFTGSYDGIVTNNQVYYGKDRGIYIGGSTGAGTQNGTIYSAYDMERVVVSGNVIGYCTAPGGVGDGIYIKLANHIMIQNNRSFSNTGAGLAFDGTLTCDYCSIIGNDLSGNPYGGYALNGQNANGICTLNIT